MDWQYYYELLPMWLRQSEGFESHFRLWYNLISGDTDFNGINNVCNVLLKLIGIFDENYTEYINSLPGAGTQIGTPIISLNSSLEIQGSADYFELYVNDNHIQNITSSDLPYPSPQTSSVSDILDKIGLLFGIRRNLSVTYNNGLQDVTENISLNNKDFLTYIKAQIVKNNYLGTNQQIEDYYKPAGLLVYIITTSTAEVKYVLALNTNITYSSNITKLFQAGELTFKPMGVSVRNLASTLSGWLVWDSTSVWDTGIWGA